jgi:hypothetical protein
LAVDARLAFLLERRSLRVASHCDVQPWEWLLALALLLQWLLQHGASSKRTAVLPPEPQASNVRAFATLGAEHFSDSAARLFWWQNLSCISA